MTAVPALERVPEVSGAGDDGFISSYCNTIPTADGGSHEAGLRSVLLRGFKSYADLIGNPMDTTIAAASLIFGGVYERLPRLKTYFAHAGGRFESSRFKDPRS